MPQFECVVRQDACIYHTCTVEAANKEEAVATALQAWKYGEGAIEFTDIGIDGFDHAECEIDECHELDETGLPKD